MRLLCYNLKLEIFSDLMNANKETNLCPEVGTDRIGNYLNQVME